MMLWLLAIRRNPLGIHWDSKEFLFKACGGLFKKADDFIDVLEKATSISHRALFYDSSQSSINDAYFCFTAPSEIPKFQIRF